MNGGGPFDLGLGASGTKPEPRALQDRIPRLPTGNGREQRQRTGIVGTVRPVQRQCPAPRGTVLKRRLGISRSQVRVLPGAPGQSLDPLVVSSARELYGERNCYFPPIATGTGPRKRSRGEVEERSGGALRVRVYAGIDPLSGKRHYLSETVPTPPAGGGHSQRRERTHRAESVPHMPAVADLYLYGNYGGGVHVVPGLARRPGHSGLRAARVGERHALERLRARL